MSKSQILVSVVVPLFNRAKLVVETIESVLVQTHKNIEILVVDDHSSDNSLAVAKRYQDSDSRVNVWRRFSSNKGAPACRNEGLARANGEYVIFLDSDDLLAVNCIDERLNSVLTGADLDFHIFPTEQFKERPGDLGLPWFRSAEDALSGFFEKPLWQTTSAIWKTESVRKLDGFREDLLSWQDWDLFVRALIFDFRYKIHKVHPDNFVRRSLHDRISVGSERDRKKLANRKPLFRDLHSMMLDSGKLNAQRQAGLTQLFIQLAVKMKIAGMPEESDLWLREIVTMNLGKVEEVDDLRTTVRKQSRLSTKQRFNELKLILLRWFHRFLG